MADTAVASFEELVGALTTRLDGLREQLASAPTTEGTVYRVDGVELDPAAHEVRVDGQPVYLRRRAFALLEVLMANAGRVVSPDTLISRCWGPEGATPNTLVRTLCTVREAIGDDKRQTVRSVRGIGYRCG